MPDRQIRIPNHGGMPLDARIYVAGHRGLVGSALLRRLEKGGYKNVVTRTHAELDLTNQMAVHDFFASEKPDYVFLAAAKVGGIVANNTCPAEFIQQNLAIQTNVIHEAWRSGAGRLLFLGSSCIYPRDCPQPIKEEYLLTGPLESTNRSYAIAKIAGIEMCWAYNRQYGTQFLAVMPTNLYGPGDNYDLQSSHVIPALIRKCHEAKMHDSSEVVVWGTGRPRREFLYNEDMADACIFLMDLPSDKFRSVLRSRQSGLSVQPLPPIINIGVGRDMTISGVAETIADIVGFKGRLVYDTNKPDGTLRKLLDVSMLHELGWCARTDLKQGIESAYADFLKSLQHSDRIA